MDQQRSFNLVRLRAIEVSRNLAATSFYQEELNLTTDRSSVADNNNSNSGSIDNLPDPASGAGRASAASRYGRDTVLTPALIHLQLEQFNDYYYQQQQKQLQQQQQPQVATTVQATPRGSALVNEAADADDESDEWLALSILELKAPHLPLPAHPPPPPPSQKIRRRRRRRRSTVSSPPAAMVPPDPSTALSVRGLHLGGGRQQQQRLR